MYQTIDKPTNKYFMRFTGFIETNIELNKHLAVYKMPDKTRYKLLTYLLLYTFNNSDFEKQPRNNCFD